MIVFSPLALLKLDSSTMFPAFPHSLSAKQSSNKYSFRLSATLSFLLIIMCSVVAGTKLWHKKRCYAFKTLVNRYYLTPTVAIFYFPDFKLN